MIKCPICGQEYHPAEIFIPKAFFGNPGEIVRNPAGQIEFFTGTGMNTEEEFVCENCGKKLRINATVEFETVVDEDSFEEEYVVNYNKPKKLKLQEEELF